MVSCVTGGFQSASCGNEEASHVLIDTVYNWIIGKGSRDRRANQKHISGSIHAEVEEKILWCNYKKGFITINANHYGTYKCLNMECGNQKCCLKVKHFLSKPHNLSSLIF